MQVAPTIVSALNQLEITTPRLHIEKLKERHREDCLRHEQDAELLKHIKDVPSEEDAKALVSSSIANWQGDEGQWLTFAIEEVSTGFYIGEVFCRYESVEFNRIEIGFRLAKNYHQQGYMTEALTAFIDTLKAITNPMKIVGYCVADNIASKKTMEKQGLEQEGLLRKYSTLNGVWHDERIFGLVLESS